MLKERGIAFVQSPAEFDEDTISERRPHTFVCLATLGKYRSALKLYDEDLPILVADTVVTCEGAILRKAKDEAMARDYLLRQSGSRVSIITCMIYKSARMEMMDLSAVHYAFAPFDPKLMEAYLKSGEWRGKAGAIMVEGFCKPYIRDMHGYESCAMGLTLEKVLPYLE